MYGVVNKRMMMMMMTIINQLYLSLSSLHKSRDFTISAYLEGR